MYLELAWHQTNDRLFFDIIDQDLAEWFVTTSQNLGNQYKLGSEMIDLLSARKSTDDLIAEEIKFVSMVNDQLARLRMPVFTMPTNWYDQRQLNRLHKDWGESRIKWPRLSEMFYKIDPKLYTAYQEMNCHIHLIEESFDYTFRDGTNWRESNPFRDRSFEWQTSNLYIPYPGHGRFAFEKFLNMDVYEDWERDNVNWDNVDALLGINLERPYRFDPPLEFVEWCQSNNLVPHNGTLPLGNLRNWQVEMCHGRQIMAKNAKIKDNWFSLQIIN